MVFAEQRLENESPAPNSSGARGTGGGTMPLHRGLRCQESSSGLQQGGAFRAAGRAAERATSLQGSGTVPTAPRPGLGSQGFSPLSLVLFVIKELFVPLSEHVHGRLCCFPGDAQQINTLQWMDGWVTNKRTSATLLHPKGLGHRGAGASPSSRRDGSEPARPGRAHVACAPVPGLLPGRREGRAGTAAQSRPQCGRTLQNL